jgi:hypothetical protein
MAKLPLNIQSFSEIRKKGLLYVDKTKYILSLITRYKTAFLSRPRRFGKSLLLDTIGALFDGDRELFRGLYIDSTEYKFPRHPVIRLNMNFRDTSSPDILKASVDSELYKIALKEELPNLDPSKQTILADLINALVKKYKSKWSSLLTSMTRPLAGILTIYSWPRQSGSSSRLLRRSQKL